MNILKDGEWDFDSLDYRGVTHCFNQRMIFKFAAEHNFSSPYEGPRESGILSLTSFSSKKVTIVDNEVHAILIYRRVVANGAFILMLFTDTEQHWKSFSRYFDIMIQSDIGANKKFEELRDGVI